MKPQFLGTTTPLNSKAGCQDKQEQGSETQKKPQTPPNSRALVVTIKIQQRTRPASPLEADCITLGSLPSGVVSASRPTLGLPA